MSTDHHTRLILWPEPEVKTPVVMPENLPPGDVLLVSSSKWKDVFEDELRPADHTTREWELARALHIRSAQPCDRVTDGLEDFYRRLAEHRNKPLES